jgi:pyridoxine 4-dehydrogenase
MHTRLGKKIGPIGYGLMGLTWRSDPPTQAESFELMNTAISCGATLFNGGELYGTPTRHSCHLLREFFETFPENSSKVLLSIKGGMKPGLQEPDASEANLRRSVDECNRVLAGTKKIDIFECARVDPNVPIEDSIKTLAKLVKEGKIGGIGLSEVKADTIRRAHVVHPIAVVEVELSLWTTDILHNGIADTCAELGIPIVAYAPLSRGALTTEFALTNEDLPLHRRNFPKFQNGVLLANRRLTEEVEKLAIKKGCKPSQAALAWIKGISTRRPQSSPIIPIPGAEKPEWIRENCEYIELTDEEMCEIGAILDRNKTIGERYMGALAKLAER